jgi:hypothetical protein
MKDNPMQFLVNGKTFYCGIITNTVDTDIDFSLYCAFFSEIKADNVGVVIMLEV